MSNETDKILEKPDPSPIPITEQQLHVISFGKIIASLIIIMFFNVIVSLLLILFFTGQNQHDSYELECLAVEQVNLSEEIKALKMVKIGTLKEYFFHTNAYQKLQKESKEAQEKIVTLEKQLDKKEQKGAQILNKAYALSFYYQILNSLTLLQEDFIQEKINVDSLAGKIKNLYSLIDQVEKHDNDLPKTKEDIGDFHVLMIKADGSQDEKEKIFYVKKAQKILSERIAIMQKSISNIDLPKQF